MGEQWGKHSVGCVPRSWARARGTDGNTQEDRTEEQQEERTGKSKTVVGAVAPILFWYVVVSLSIRSP